MSKMLFDTHPLVVDPDLATKTGLNEAIIIQQIHYWLKLNGKTEKNFQGGYYWTYNTFEDWQKQFPFWSLITIKRIIGKLESKGLIISGNYNKMKTDRTKWYRINYEALEALIESPKYQNDTLESIKVIPSKVSKRYEGKYQKDTTITRDYTETKKEKQQQAAVVVSLVGLGLKEDKAQALVKQYGQLVERWLPLAKDKKNPAGYIVKALEEEWELPPTAKPKKQYEVRIFTDSQGVERAERVEVAQ